MPPVRALLPLAALPLAALALSGPALAQSAPDRLNPDGSRADPGRYRGLAVEPRGQGPGVGYGVTYFGWPLVPYYGGSASGPGVSGLGPRALASGYANAWYGFTAPPREDDLRAEIAARDLAARAKAKPAPTTLTVELPAEAQVWVNGAARPGVGRTWVLPGGTDDATFAVRAEWVVGGKRFAWERTVAVPAGASSRVTVGAGSPVK